MAHRQRTQHGKARLGLIFGLSILVLVAAGGAILYGAHQVRENNQLFYIPSESMLPTLQIDDRVATDKLDTDSTIERGQIVITAPVDAGDSSIAQVRRVIGLPNETIEARNGEIYVDNQRLDEPYLRNGTNTANVRRVTLGTDEYYLLGDNRENSTDSRVYGPLTRASIEYRVTSIVYPTDRAGSISE